MVAFFDSLNTSNVVQSETTRALVRVRSIVLVTAIAVAVLAACGGSESESPSESPARESPSATSPSATSSVAEAEDLAEEVSQHYFDALDRLGAILDQDLQVDDLREEVGNLKDEYIALLLPYGYQREEMSDAERDKFGSTMNLAMVLATPPALDKLNVAVASLKGAGETSLANEVLSFNIITQYVFFELLKEQEPQEAERLSIP